MDPAGLETVWEHYTGLPDQHRVNAINAIAGASDAGTFGLTYLVRDALGINRDVDQCSNAYADGEWASVLFGGARLAYAGIAKVAAQRAVSMEAAVAFRNGLKRFFRGPFAGSSYRIKDAGELLQRYGSEEAVRAAAGRTNSGVNTVGGTLFTGGSVGLAIGCGCP